MDYMQFITIVSACIVCMGITALIVIILARRVTQKYKALSYNVRDPQGIESMVSVKIGGVKQCLHIRSRDKDNPVLLFIHGGPGISQIGWYDSIQRPWEDYFTVVQWDQRQVGKSYIDKNKGEKSSNQQMIIDTEEVVDFVRRHLNKKKLFIMGWSYGTYLGMHVVKRRPEWIYAYVALGQFVGAVENFQEEHALLLKHAVDQNDRELVSHLEGMVPRIDPSNKLVSFLKYAGSVATELTRIGKTGWRYITIQEHTFLMKYDYFTSPHYSLRELFRLRAGRGVEAFMAFSEDFMKIDVPDEVGSKFEVPIFFFMGRHDWHVPSSLADKWYQEITAPHKEQIWFEKSAHFLMQEEPGRMLVAMVEKVLPLAASE